MRDSKIEQLVVVKRNGKKVEFDGKKIALAIKKGFDSINNNLEDNEEQIYSEKDIQKVYLAVMNRIEKEYETASRIKIENIQDMIEEELNRQNYKDVYRSFADYRERRNRSREMFFDEKKTHHFLKSIEHLGLKSIIEEENRKDPEKDGNTPIGMMLQYGATVSKAFAQSYLMKQKYAEAHDNGDWYIHDLDFLATGTTTCCQIDLSKLYKRGFDTGHGSVRPPKDISTYASLAAIVMQATINDQHGGESIAAFDYDMAPGVLKTFKRLFKEALCNILEFTDYQSFLSMDRIHREIDRLESMEFDFEPFHRIAKDTNQVKRIFELAYQQAYRRTKRATEQAMESLIYDLNRMFVRKGTEVPPATLNFGTDTSVEGRLVTSCLLKSLRKGLGNGEAAQYPITVFKVKKGINCQVGDPNYELFLKACEVSLERGYPNFSFLDAPYHQVFYQEGKENTEVAYVGNRMLLTIDVNDQDAEVTGRGVLTTTTLNLPRLGIKYGICLKERSLPDLDGFFQELEINLDLIVEQLLERFEISCDKSSNNFPFLVGQGVWNDGELAKPSDRLRKLWKHGSLAIGFVGLAECLKALTGKHHGESEESQALGLQIIRFIRQKLDRLSEEWKVNFTCYGTPCGKITTSLIELDKAIYGSIKGVTNKSSYTDSFHLPKTDKKSWKQKLWIEAPYHALTNGGHELILSFDQPVILKQFVSLIEEMEQAGIGYAKIEHPLVCLQEKNIF